MQMYEKKRNNVCHAEKSAKPSLDNSHSVAVF